MKKSVCFAIAITLLTSVAAQAGNYTVRDRFYQAAASNVEEADITIIRCSDRKEYYIYSYYRNGGPWYRTIFPPHWGTPIGGGDHYKFEDAVGAACH